MSTTRTRIRWGLGLALAFTGAVTVIPPAAQADHANAAASGRLYTASWPVCNSGQTAGVSATSWAMGQINVTDVNSYTVGCPQTWRVSVTSLNYPETWYGLTVCHGTVSSRVCRPSKGVRLNGRVITTTQQWRKTSLHELGHVAGLGHRSTNSSAMTQGASPPVSMYFDTHDKGAINASY